MAFDVFVRNSDRHEGNLFAQRSVANPQEYSLVVFDHTHCLLDGQAVTDWWSAGKQFVRIPALKSWVPTTDAFESVLADIEGLADSEIESYAASVPREWYSDADRGATASLLSGRKRKVRGWIAGNFNV